MVGKLLLARSHPAEMLDPGKDALHVVPLPVGSLIERTSSTAIVSSRDHTADAPTAYALADGAGEVGRISHDLARPAPRSAALAAAQLQAVDQGSKTLLVVALTWCKKESQRPPLAVDPHVQLGEEAAAAAA